MTCEHLMCAHCAGPVVEGRCAACRAARAQVHRRRTGLSLPLVLAALVALVLLVAALRMGGAGG